MSTVLLVFLFQMGAGGSVGPVVFSQEPYVWQEHRNPDWTDDRNLTVRDHRNPDFFDDGHNPGWSDKRNPNFFSE